MATNLENLQTSLANLTAELASVTASPGPDYQIEGQRVDKAKYLKQLNQAIADVRQLIVEESGIWEHQSEAIP